MFAINVKWPAVSKHVSARTQSRADDSNELLGWKKSPTMAFKIWIRIRISRLNGCSCTIADPLGNDDVPGTNVRCTVPNRSATDAEFSCSGFFFFCSHRPTVAQQLSSNWINEIDRFFHSGDRNVNKKHKRRMLYVVLKEFTGLSIQRRVSSRIQFAPHKLAK